jgi:hypothetical protein
MCELYAPQQIAIPDAQTDWKTWGNGLSAIDVFTNEAIPRTDQYDNWHDWAEALVSAVNPSTSST